MTKRFGHFVHSDRGAAAVEFALVSVVLMILLVGLFQFARLFQAQLAVTHAAREGARQASVNRFDEAYVKQQAAPLPAADVDVVMTEDASDPDNKVEKVVVSYSFSFWLVNTNWTSSFLPPVVLRSKAQMRAEF